MATGEEHAIISAGQRLLLERERLKLGQVEAARICGVSDSWYQQAESGRGKQSPWSVERALLRLVLQPTPGRLPRSAAGIGVAGLGDGMMSIELPDRSVSIDRESLRILAARIIGALASSAHR